MKIKDFEDCGQFAFIVVWVIQIIANIHGLAQWFGIHILFAVVLVIPLAYLFPLSYFVAMLAAVKVWGWCWWVAVPVFASPLVMPLIWGDE